jgi:hypothetical protein
MRYSRRVWLAALAVLILMLVMLALIAPEAVFCNPLAFRVLRFIPDGCLRWRVN